MSITVSSDSKQLLDDDGNRFFYLADTAWELLHALSIEESELYLDDRAAKGFTVVQTVGLAELGGLHTPNAIGELPLAEAASSTLELNPEYWKHVARVVAAAGERGLVVALLPTWGDKWNRGGGTGPEILTPENARTFGRSVAECLGDLPNIIWVLRGDRDLREPRHYAIIRRIAAGLAEGEERRHLMTFHPCGGSSSSQCFHGEPWLSFNMVQSGHGLTNSAAWRVARDYALLPQKPVINGEPRYEDIPRDFDPENGYWRAVDVRRDAWWSLLSGACGHSYGHHAVWQMNLRPTDLCPFTWREALGRPGAEQVGGIASFLAKRDRGDLHPRSDLIDTNAAIGSRNYVACASGERYAYAYFPTGRAKIVRLAALGWAKARAAWLDPRTFGSIDLGTLDARTSVALTPPGTPMRGADEAIDPAELDWLLVLDRSE